MKFIDFFSGIGGFRLGMEKAGHECVGHCEINKHADKSYRAMHDMKGDEWFADDITRVDAGELPDADCYCGGFPCQSFSIAGKRGGFADTRGTLFFEVMRLARERKPRYLFLENVAGLLSHDGGNTFTTILQSFADNGYNVQWALLNTKDFGLPHNRERVFFVGSLRGQPPPEIFPIRQDGREVVELQGQQNIANCITARYEGSGGGTYIIERKLDAQIKQIGNIDQNKRKRDNPTTGRVYDITGISPCLGTMQGGGLEPKIYIPEATKQGYAIAQEGDSINLAVPNSKTRRGRVGVGVANTLDTSCSQAVYTKGRIRRLTPKECFRLQGFPDEYFYRAQATTSDRQLYKQAGNSVSVPVIYEIAKKLRG